MNVGSNVLRKGKMSDELRCNCNTLWGNREVTCSHQGHNLLWAPKNHLWSGRQSHVRGMQAVITGWGWGLIITP